MHSRKHQANKLNENHFQDTNNLLLDTTLNEARSGKFLYPSLIKLPKYAVGAGYPIDET